ncbi:MAG TPA: chloride channel protein [Candidatus Limnocylindria bacterium]
MTESDEQQQQALGLAYLRLIGIAALIGIPAAVVAALFLGTVHVMERWLWDDLPTAMGVSSPPWFLVLGLPTAGAAIVVLARRFLPGDGGHPPMHGLSSDATPVAYVPGVVLAALGSLPFGAVLGPELPVIALGTAVGVLANRFARLSGREAAVLTNAGSFSAISALFGGPLVAGVLLVEGGLSAGAALIPVLLPGLVAAAVGYLIFVGLGSWAGLGTPGLVVPALPVYDGELITDLLVGIAVGVLAVIVVAVIKALAVRTDAVRDRVGMPLLLLGGGLAVGALALLAGALGANPQDVLFSGQASIGVVVGAGSVSLVLVLVLAKALAYAISLGCGYRGGPIFPAIFLGVGLAAVAVVVLGTSPTLAVAVGAAAGMAAQTRLLLSSILLAALLVGPNGADAVPAAVMAATAAWLAAAMLPARLSPASRT